MSDSNKILITYDFDWSLADKDSDHHVLEYYYPDGIGILDQSGIWIETMQSNLKVIHSKGTTPEQIQQCLSTFPISSNMVEAILLAKKQDHSINIISDGNSLFLSTILKNYKLIDCFDNIITNEAKIEGNLITLLPVFNTPPNCNTKANGIENTCSVNLCKGIKVKQLKNRFDYKKTIYIGDGMNDFCAGCALDEGDLFLVRKGRKLAKILTTDSHQIKAKIIYWDQAKEVLDVFKKEL
ncbi:hypothetical protein K502DRAFT_340506 [Neoconidiobolus thromboides FSU 785]|nr:hypothetical protein K502DRAFT_340506 [Neoconidiobolus thromboides FSU 785]